ncbi:MAG: peptidyl-prolyl cis-trans isomerase [Alphaproteobacteria bacterium]
MLRAMRGAAQTWVIKLLLIFLIISFAVWGVGDMFRGNPQQRVVACIGGFYIPFKIFFGSTGSICTGKSITVQNLLDGFQRNVELARKTMGPDFTPQVARQMGYLDNTLSELIAYILYERPVQESGLKFDDTFILQELTNAPSLRTKDGKFDAEAFRNAASKMRMTEQEFLDYARKSYERDLILATMAGAVELPKIVTDEIVVAHGQERHIQVLRLAHDTLDVPAKPNDEERRKYHADHGAQFTAPEYRSVSVLEILFNDIMKNTVISDEEIAAAFDKRQEEFALPERRSLLQVILHDEAKANAVAAEAKSGKDLKKIAAAQRLNPINLEDQTEQNILPSLYTNVFTASTGAIIGPIHTDYGWHVMQLTQIKPATQPTLADVKDALRAKLQQERAAEDLQNVANKVDDDLAGGKSLEEIAEAYKFKLTKHPALDAAGLTQDGKSSGIALPDITLKNAFGLNEGESSSLLDDRRGNYLVLHVDKIIASHVRDLSSVQDQVDAAWRADQQTQAAAAEAAKLADLWRHEPHTYNDLLKKRGVSAVATHPVSLLSGFDKALPHTMQKEVFALKLGEVTIGADAGAHYLVRLSEYKALKTAENAEAQDALKKRMANDWRTALMEQYEALLQKETPPYVNRAIIDELRHTASLND